MALKTYSDLQNKILVTAQALRDFTEVDVKDFIALAETDIAFIIDHYLMDKSVSLTTSTNSITLPDNFLELRYISADAKETIQVPISGATICSDQVGYYQNGNTYVFVPSSSTPRNIVLNYTARIDPLSDAAPTNWLLTRFPAVYLHASLVRVYRYLQDSAAEGAEAKSLSDALAVVAQDNKRGQKVGNPLSWRANAY